MEGKGFMSCTAARNWGSIQMFLGDLMLAIFLYSRCYNVSRSPCWTLTAVHLPQWNSWDPPAGADSTWPQHIRSLTGRRKRNNLTQQSVDNRTIFLVWPVWSQFSESWPHCDFPSPDGSIDPHVDPPVCFSAAAASSCQEITRQWGLC